MQVEIKVDKHVRKQLPDLVRSEILTFLLI